MTPTRPSRLETPEGTIYGPWSWTDEELARRHRIQATIGNSMGYIGWWHGEQQIDGFEVLADGIRYTLRNRETVFVGDGESIPFTSMQPEPRIEAKVDAVRRRWWNRWV